MREEIYDKYGIFKIIIDDEVIFFKNYINSKEE